MTDQPISPNLPGPTTAAESFETVVLEAPWKEVTPEEALRWLSENFEDWSVAARCLVVYPTVPRDSAYWILNDVEHIARACIHAIKTQQSVKIKFADDMMEPETIIEILAHARRRSAA